MEYSIHLLLICLKFATIFVTTWACQSSFFLTRIKEPSEKSVVAPWSELNVSTVEKRIEENCECGLRPRKSSRISGGEDADKNEFCFQAAMVYRNTRIPFCSGTLINSKFILSAAHCLLNLPKILTTKSQDDFLIENDFQVLLNAHKLNTLNGKTTVELYKRLLEKSWELDPEDKELDFEEGTLRFDVKRKIFHPEFVTEYRKLRFDYDIALLELETPVNLTLRNAPVPTCLPRMDDPENNFEKEVVITVGWGRTNFRDLTSGSPTLQKIQVPVYSLDECSKISGIHVSRRFICAGHQTKKKDIGKSDSGGPLLFKNGFGQFVQIGITSWGAGEEDGHVASAFTRVSEFLPWIFYHMKESSKGRNDQDPDILWCADERHDEQFVPTTTMMTDEFNDDEDVTTTEITTTEKEPAHIV